MVIESRLSGIRRFPSHDIGKLRSGKAINLKPCGRRRRNKADLCASRLVNRRDLEGVSDLMNFKKNGHGVQSALRPRGGS